MVERVESEAAFFRRIHAEVRTAFDESSVRRKQERLGQQWSWNVCALPIRRGQDLLLGLNWRWNKAHGSYSPSTEPPDDEEADKVGKYPFIRRSLALLVKYGFDLATMNYFNVCPFRSPSIDELDEEDWRLSIDRFFVDTIDYVMPRRTLILGTTAVRKLAARELIANVKWITRGDPERRVSGARGSIVGRSGHAHSFFAVPHPNAQISTRSRHAIWAALLAGRSISH